MMLVDFDNEILVDKFLANYFTWHQENFILQLDFISSDVMNINKIKSFIMGTHFLNLAL